MGLIKIVCFDVGGYKISTISRVWLDRIGFRSRPSDDSITYLVRTEEAAMNSVVRTLVCSKSSYDDLISLECYRFQLICSDLWVSTCAS